MKKTARKDMILKYIVEQFVKSAQPVGSKSLIEEYNLDLSSATIRNEMQELENLGFLEKTHTSSGRVPSARGYQYYIDNLRENKLNNENKNKIKHLIAAKSSIQVNDVLREGCAILSEMTSLASIMLGPDELGEELQKIQLIPVSENSAVCVLVTSNGHIEHKSFEIPRNIQSGDVEKCVDILNDRLKGTPLYSLIEKMLALKPVLSMYIEQYEILINTFMNMFKDISTDKTSYWGASNLIAQPEYANDVNKLKKAVKLIESNNVWKFISNNTNKKINVQIGVNDDLADFSVVSADVKVKGQEGSKIALVGPSRMDYSKVIGAMEFLLKQLDDIYGLEESEEDMDG